MSATPGRGGGGPPKARGIARLLAVTAACALMVGLFFFGLLTLWGVIAAPFVRLRSASFVIVVALALSGALTAVAYRAFSRRASRRSRGTARP